MAGIKVIRPMEIGAYSCDGPGCDQVCAPERRDVHVIDALDTRHCGWVILDDPDGLRNEYGPAREARRGFHDWRCAARWAYTKGVEHGDITVPAPPELRIGTGHYGKAA